jgi:peptide/nickel transport system ATP-binding protein/oligopeptide transport system ATP-binding protein
MTDSNETILTVRDIQVRYPTRHRQGEEPGNLSVLRGVDLSLTRGEIAALVGESGCGKSTLVLSVLGVVKPSHGVVEFCGRDLQTMSRDERIAFSRNVQIVWQEPASSLDPSMSVEQVVQEPLAIHHMGNAAERRELARRLLSQFGVSAPLHRRRPGALSGGQQQCVAIARALATRPELVLLDEPFGALDLAARVTVIERLLRRQQEDRTTLLFVLHDLDLVSRLAPRLLVMHEGRIVEDGPTAEIMSKPQHDYTRRLVELL